MKVVILAGGFGTRLSEETEVKPKPMVEVGGKPLLWHIMKIFSHQGINEFIICLGYKGEKIKRFFLDYSSNMSDVTIDMQNNEVTFHKTRAEKWRVTLLDTGSDTMTGGRIRKAIEFMNDDSDFFMTYGDGVSDIDLQALNDWHKSRAKLATVTAVTPPGRFGVLDIDHIGNVNGFREKIASDQYRINGGFFVLNPRVVDLIDDDQTIWELKPMEQLAKAEQLTAYQHNGFWMPMDTLRDKIYLNQMWDRKSAPWKIW